MVFRVVSSIMAVRLEKVVEFCDQRSNRAEVRDFPGSYNGLQLANNGKVTRIGAAVDAGRVPFEKCREEGIDFLIVHHGMFWTLPIPLTGSHYDKVKMAMDSNLAVYGSHLPLDAHPEIGNNRLLANALGLEVADWFLPYEGVPIALKAKAGLDRATLKHRLEKHFPAGFQAIEYGEDRLEHVAILTGSGRSALPELAAAGVDTLITGELRQEHFNYAQEHRLNLYLCGHYATEVFGVKALARDCAKKFGLEWSFVATECPL